MNMIIVSLNNLLSNVTSQNVIHLALEKIKLCAVECKKVLYNHHYQPVKIPESRVN